MIRLCCKTNPQAKSIIPLRSIILTLWMWPRITFISSSPSLTVCKFYFRATRVGRYVRGRIIDTATDPPQLPTIQLEGSEGVVITCYSSNSGNTKKTEFFEVISDISRISRCSFLNTEDFRLRLFIIRVIYKLEKQDFLVCTLLYFVLQFIRRAKLPSCQIRVCVPFLFPT